MGVDTVRADSTGGVQSVDRALTILEVLARVGEAGVTEIAADLGVHKSTAFRLVAPLEQERPAEETAGRGGRARAPPRGSAPPRGRRLAGPAPGPPRRAGATTARLALVQEARPV